MTLVTKAPCSSCPFRNKPTAEPPVAFAPAETFLGQAVGPFLFPCHNAIDLDNPTWRTADHLESAPQCAGGAIFRTHIGVAGFLPPQLALLPASDEVFKTPAEFMAHHRGITVAEAQARLAVRSPGDMLVEQLMRQDNSVKRTG